MRMPHCITLHTAYYLHVTGTFQSLCKSCPITVTNDMTEEHSVLKMHVLFNGQITSKRRDVLYLRFRSLCTSTHALCASATTLQG